MTLSDKILLPDTKLGENIFQQIVRRNRPSNLTQVIQRLFNIHRQEI